MVHLADKACGGCKGQGAPLKGEAIAALLSQLNDWKVIDEHHLEKGYAFKNFQEALRYVNRVGEVAEREGHHPEILLGWGRVKITIWTHAINGLSEADFILAAKCDKAL